MKTLTWSDFDQYEPCYSPAECYGEWSGTILDLIKREDIPSEDRIWAATRDGILDDKTLRLFACKCVREVWHLLTDERSRNAVEVAERFAMGDATDKELADARDAGRAAWADARAAWDAARAAAWAAAWDDAREAAIYAARAAAWAAAWDDAREAAIYAAWDAARADAREAAWDATRENQVQMLIELIEEVQP